MLLLALPSARVLSPPPLLLPRDSHSAWLENRDWPRVARFWSAQSSQPGALHQWLSTTVGGADGGAGDPWVDERVSATATAAAAAAAAAAEEEEEEEEEETFQWTEGEIRGLQRDRATYFVTIGYDGACFNGWQEQRNNDDEEGSGVPTVAGVVRGALEDLLEGRNGGKPLGQLTVAGRTDRSVSAVEQVCSFHTWEHTPRARQQRLPERGTSTSTSTSTATTSPEEESHEGAVQQESRRQGGQLHALTLSSSSSSSSTTSAASVVSGAAVRRAVAVRCAAAGLPTGAISVHRLQRVPRRLHPRFSARWRRYAFLLPLNHLQKPPKDGVGGEEEQQQQQQQYRYDICPAAMNAALRGLEGRPLRYNALAFGRLGGADEDSDRCTLLRARASLVHLDDEDEEGGRSPAILLELVGDRFLRRMVRVLIATAARIAACPPSTAVTVDHVALATTGPGPGSSGACSEAEAGEALRRIVEGGDRGAAAHPAPACGLAFIGVGYASDRELLGEL